MRLLINILTHGDELVGKKVADELTRRYPHLLNDGVDIQIANQEAFKKGQRYVEEDLNRVFPGNQTGSYEARRAYELKPIIAAYDLVIDIHSTESGSGDMIIVTQLDQETKKIVEVISPRYVLYMNMKPDTSLISCAKIGLAFEMGSDKDEGTVSKTLQGIETILNHFKFIQNGPNQTPNRQTDYFEVFTSILKPPGATLLPHIENFLLIQKGEVFAKTQENEEILAEYDFYPVIFGSHNYETIFGFAARKIQ